MSEANAAGLSVTYDEMRAEVEKEMYDETAGQSSDKRCVFGLTWLPCILCDGSGRFLLLRVGFRVAFCIHVVLACAPMCRC